MADTSRTYAFALWQNKFAKEPRSTDALTWPEFVDDFQTCPKASDKQRQIGWTPFELIRDELTEEERTNNRRNPKSVKGLRSLRNVRRVTMAVVDLDECTNEGITNLLDELEREQIKFLMHTTASHTKKTPKLRLILPLSKPIAAERWKGAWLDMANQLNSIEGVKVDGQCKDSSRLYFIPSCVRGCPDPMFEFNLKGACIELDDTVVPMVNLDTLESDFDFDRMAAEQLLKKLKRRGTQDALANATTLRKILAGASFAVNGKRDITMFNLASAIVRSFPSVDPKSVARLMRPSLAKDAELNPFDPFGIETVIDKVERAKLNVVEQEAEHKPRRTGNDWEEDELKDVKRRMHGLKNRWIIVNNQGAFLRGRKGFFFVNKGRLVESAKDFLAHAPGVELTYRSEQTGALISKPEKRLIEEYGSFCDSVIYSYTADGASYDPNESNQGTLFLPVERGSVPEAKYSERVAKWLRLLSGERHREVLQWLANSHDTEKMLPILALTGPKSVGKTVLARGVAAAWGALKPTNAAQAFSNFDGALLKCPIVLADEELPKDYRGRPQTEQLRAFICEETRQLNPKYGKQVLLKGYPRLIVAANNQEVITMGDQRTKADVDAVAERILHVPCDVKAARYIEQLKAAQGDVIDAEWFGKSNELGAHIRWLSLQDEHAYDRNERFGVKTRATELAMKMTLRSGKAPLIVEWIVRSLVQEPHAGVKYLADKKGAAINLASISSSWTDVGMVGFAPSTTQLSAALRELTSTQLRVREGDLRYLISDEVLFTWCRQHMLFDIRKVKAAMAGELQTNIRRAA